MKRYKYFTALLFAALMGVSFAACSDSDDNSGSGNPDSEGKVSYNDLSYLQKAIIEVDAEGNFLARTCGEVLNVSEPHHLYVGVESLEEAKQRFLGWLAPDVNVTTTASGFSAQLSDEEGHAQGTVYFTAASANGQVAEVTASADTKLQYFDKVTFLLNSAWPVNAAEKIYHVGDVITHSPVTPHYLPDRLRDCDKTMKFLCIRESGNGNNPLFVTLTEGTYTCGGVDYYDKYVSIRDSKFCPGESKAKEISKILVSNWDYFHEAFKAQGIDMRGDTNYWVDELHFNWVRFYGAINLPSGILYGYKVGESALHFLLKIDWMDDATIYTTLVGTKGSAGISGEDFQKLFDGTASTKWCSHVNWRTDGKWFVEFKANTPLKAVGYKLTTAGDIEKYTGRNPKTWRLLARNDEEDEWVEIANETNGALPTVNGYTKSYSIPTPSKYLYYRWEITDNDGGADVMMISGFSLVV